MFDTLATALLRDTRIDTLKLGFDFHMLSRPEVLTADVRRREEAEGVEEQFHRRPPTRIPDRDILFELGESLASRFPALRMFRVLLKGTTPRRPAKARKYLLSVHRIADRDIQYRLHLDRPRLLNPS
jgi:hypothetical protein